MTCIVRKEAKKTGEKICVEIRSALRQKRHCSTHAEQEKAGEIM